MKLAITTILAVVTVALAATAPQKSVIVSYPDETPDSVVEQAKNAIVAAGGMITHEYKLIKQVMSSPCSEYATNSCTEASQRKRQPRS